MLQLLYAQWILAQRPNRLLQPVLCRDRGSAGGTDISHIWGSKCLTVCFALRSPGDKAGSYVQHMCGRLCRVKTAVHILLVVLMWVEVIGIQPVTSVRIAPALDLLMFINTKWKWNFSHQWDITLALLSVLSLKYNFRNFFFLTLCWNSVRWDLFWYRFLYFKIKTWNAFLSS